jgi:hypothetical protein
MPAVLFTIIYSRKLPHIVHQDLLIPLMKKGMSWKENGVKWSPIWKLPLLQYPSKLKDDPVPLV